MLKLPTLGGPSLHGPDGMGAFHAERMIATNSTAFCHAAASVWQGRDALACTCSAVVLVGVDCGAD